MKGFKSQVLSQHSRDVVSIPADAPTCKMPKDAFQHCGKTVGVDLNGIHNRATWPCYTPQTCQTLPAQLHLLRELHKNDRFEAAAEVWKSMLVKGGTVVRDRESKEVFMCLGDVGAVAQLTWPLEHVDVKKTEVYILSDKPQKDACAFYHVYDLAQVEVIPTSIVSVLHFFLLNGRKLHPRQGIAWKRVGKNVSLLNFLAGSCFANVPVTVLRKLCKSEGVLLQKGASDVDVVATLMKHALPSASESELAKLMELRGVGVYDEIDEVPKEILEDVFERDDMKSVEDLFMGGRKITIIVRPVVQSCAAEYVIWLKPSPPQKNDIIKSVFKCRLAFHHF